METTFNTPSHGAVASLFHYVSTSEGQDAVFLPPPLTDTVVMSNDSCQGSEGASKWTDTGCVKTPRAKSTDNIIILRTLYRMMRPGELMWLMRGAPDVILHILFKTVAQRACCVCCHLEGASDACAFSISCCTQRKLELYRKWSEVRSNILSSTSCII